MQKQFVIHPLQKLAKGVYLSQDGRLLFKKNEENSWKIQAKSSKDNRAHFAQEMSNYLNFRKLKELISRIEEYKVPGWEAPIVIRPLTKEGGYYSNNWLSFDRVVTFCRDEDSLWEVQITVGSGINRHIKHPPWLHSDTVCEWMSRHRLSSCKTLKELIQRVETADRIDPLHKLFTP